MAEKPFKLPDRDESMLDSLSLGLEQGIERELMVPRDFYRHYREVLSEADTVLGHAYRALDQFQAWRRPMDASQLIQKIDRWIQQLSAFKDNLRDEIMAALKIQSTLILDTEQEATAYIAKLEPQPQVAAQSILAEYHRSLAAIESGLKSKESIQEK